MSPLQSTKAVLLDVDGTLYRQAPVRVHMALEMAWYSLATFSIRRMIRLIRGILYFRRFRERLRAVGRPSGSLDELQYSEPARELGEEAAGLRGTVLEWMQQRPLRHVAKARRPGVGRFLRLLQARDIKAGAFSDYPVLAKLEALQLADHFSVTLCATDCEINAFKPHPAGFLRACEIWNLTPSEVLYIGDRPEVDAAGARAAGMPCLIIGAKNGATGYCGVTSFDELCHEIENSR
jgi:HAD superfamily hydrolase (TIGR01549 family)